MKFHIHYESTYDYTAAVTENINALRLRPTDHPDQRVTGVDLRVVPVPRMFEHRDYFGTWVHDFDVVTAHERLAIEMVAHVETSAPAEPPEVGWDALDGGYIERMTEFLQPHPAAQPHVLLDEIARDVRSTTPLATACRLAETIPQRFEYRRGVTYVGSTVADLLAAGAGVCQDFVHLSLAVLRGMGIASRYCSGYLFASDGSGRDSIEVDTHAWLEICVPTGSGEEIWVGVDPTNGGLAEDRHIKIGHGRWYSDVPPIKGVYRGPPGGDLTVRVTMTRVD